MATSDKYTELYHYTGETGLRGIIETQELWATHYSCLNDSQELLCFEKTLKNYSLSAVDAVIKKLGIDEKRLSERFNSEDGVSGITRLSAQVLRQSFLEEKSEEPYIVSFCSANDEYERNNGLLSQWKGYGSGGGYALVFDTKRLEELVQQEREVFLGAMADPSVLEMKQVVYSDEEAYDSFPEDLETLKEFVCWMAENWFKKPDLQAPFETNEIEKMHHEYLPAYRRCMPRCKHQGFKEEKEIRIVATIFDKKYSEGIGFPRKEIKNRTDSFKKSEIQYIELFSKPKAVKKFKMKNILPIERIIVGPSIDKGIRAERIKGFLNKVGIEVVISETPFV